MLMVLLDTSFLLPAFGTRYSQIFFISLYKGLSYAEECLKPLRVVKQSVAAEV
ncbi:MAG: hypothetical protein QXW42_06415 [Thermofilum sp.]|uniref:hypothetical protein n=1 Tax=Thermofilum TaxID=2268 RepID=UPI000B1F0671|nr:hypothetical protein [Thermofilum adornatum]